MKKKKITQIHGKVEDFKPTTLDQVWGGTGASKYKTLELDKYKESLAEMNLSDLQAHAIKIGIIPSDSRDLIIKKLLKEFTLYSNEFKHPINNTKLPVKLSKEALKILAEGK